MNQRLFTQTMKVNALVCFLAAVLWIGVGMPSRAGETAAEVVALWKDGKMPGHGAAGSEKELPARGDNVVRLTDISDPTITVFRARGVGKATPAVIICPGGGYNLLAYNKEGSEVAAWLNSIGITGIVLKYRVPGNQDGAFQDLQRAVRMVRHNASAWNIAADRVGVMGFSAGGHLCARLSTNADQASYLSLDGVDEEKFRPDFAVLIYPAYLSRVAGKLAADLPVSGRTPPTFIVHTEDDRSLVAGSKVYHAALEAAQVANEFFLCATGGHGYGLRSDKEVGVWPEKCRQWLMRVGVL